MDHCYHYYQERDHLTNICGILRGKILEVIKRDPYECLYMEERNEKHVDVIFNDKIYSTMTRGRPRKKAIDLIKVERKRASQRSQEL